MSWANEQWPNEVWPNDVGLPVVQAGDSLSMADSFAMNFLQLVVSDQNNNLTDRFGKFLEPSYLTDQMGPMKDSIEMVLEGNVGANRTLRIFEQLNIVDGPQIIAGPILHLTQFPREVIWRTIPNLRLTQFAKEVITRPLSSNLNLRMTQFAREIITQTPEAFGVIDNYYMEIGEQLFMQETLFFFKPGDYKLIVGERNAPGFADQDTNQNVKVKKNTNIKATNFVTSDTSLNHWQDTFVMNFIPNSKFQAFSDNEGGNWADSLTKSLLVYQSELLAEQLSQQDSASVVMQHGETFIQFLNNWQEFVFPFVVASIAEHLDDFAADAIANVLSFEMPVSDQLLQTDTTNTLFGYGLLATEQLTQLDSTALVEAFLAHLSDDEGPNWADNFVFKGPGISASEQLVLTDAMLLGYGDLIAEQLFMADADVGEFGFQTSGALAQQDSMLLGYGLLASDVLVFSDRLVSGEIESFSEQMNMADAVALVESIEVMLSDATPAMLEAAQILLIYGLTLDDVVVFQEQLTYLYGLIVQGDTLSLADQYTNTLDLLLPFLADSDVAAWLDALILEMVYAPKAIVASSLEILLEMTGKMLVQPEVNAAGVTVEPLDEIEKVN